MDNIRWLYVWELNSVRAHKVLLTLVFLRATKISDVTFSYMKPLFAGTFQKTVVDGEIWHPIPLKCSSIWIWIWYETFTHDSKIRVKGIP